MLFSRNYIHFLEQLMEQLNHFLKKYKSEPEMEYLNIILKNKELKVKNNLLKLEKDFRKLKDREIKLKRKWKTYLPK